MPQPLDTSAIQRLVARARRRIRAQWALEGAALATIIGCAVALVAIFAMRTEMVAGMTGDLLLVGAGAIVVLGAVISAARKLDDEVVARRIDRANNLSDRLSTAIAFQRAIGKPAADDTTTHDLMVAAIADGERAAPRANVKAATPFTAPKDARAAALFIVLCAVIAAIRIPMADRSARVGAATPGFAPGGTEIDIEGERLTTTIAAPDGASVYLGERPVAVLSWTANNIRVRLPDDAPIGDTKLAVYAHGDKLGATDFKVVDRKDIRYHKNDSVALEPDEKAYVETILAELRNVAQRDKVPELDDFANKIEKLLEKAENGEISKEELLEALAKAEEALNKDNEPNPEEVANKLSEMGKELKTDPVTKDLGEALEKKDLEKAQKELEKLAEKLDKKELSEKQKDELAKKLDQVAKQMEKKDEQEQKKADDRQKKLEEEIRRLEKQKQEAKNDKQREDMERRLEEKKRELKKLQKDEEQKQASEQRRAVKRLEKDMEKAAENLQKPQKKEGEQDKDQEERERQASQGLKDAARETGRVDQDQRKQASQKKMSSQMDDLREAMRRAKQKGNKGPQDPFNKNRKNQDFAKRAGGKKSGQGQSWKPGQGQGQGQGQGSGQGQNGQQNGGKEWGTGHDDNLEGDETQISGNEKDVDIQGKQGNQGGSTRETILAAAQKGFASQRYSKVYADYQRIVEEVMRTEKLPSSYKYYVKRYFAKIHPSMTAPVEDKKP